MPTQQEMAEAYIVQVEGKLQELEAQVATLTQHIAECRAELTSDVESDEETEE